jgi:hypothetical protein
MNDRELRNAAPFDFLRSLIPTSWRQSGFEMLNCKNELRQTMANFNQIKVPVRVAQWLSDVFVPPRTVNAIDSRYLTSNQVMINLKPGLGNDLMREAPTFVRKLILKAISL